MSKAALALILAAEFGRAADEGGRWASSTAATAAVCERCRNFTQSSHCKRSDNHTTCWKQLVGWVSWVGGFDRNLWLRQTLYTQTNKRFEDGPRCDRRVPWQRVTASVSVLSSVQFLTRQFQHTTWHSGTDVSSLCKLINFQGQCFNTFTLEQHSLRTWISHLHLSY